LTHVNFNNFELCIFSLTGNETKMVGRMKSETLGKTVFYLTLAGVLVFFWWLLIYDHGVVAVH